MTSPDLVISAHALGKQFRLGQRAKYRTLRESIAAMFSARSKADSASRSANLFWALQDVSFDVRQGEAVGIIGRNGAGKSTLLKVLSRITSPTVGRAVIRGRVGNLLEVGTGFHPELSGRENIFLNGAILGMRRAEIRARFDEIVSYAEIDRFIDTPVKHYSSGMYMRLAFSVAAHLEPEILVVDEVLAVGDAAFQKKCIGKMADTARSGRTVLFVSHNMPAVRLLCDRGILLDGGRIVHDGAIDGAIAAYQASHASSESTWKRPAPGGGPLCFQSISATLLGAQPHHTLRIEMELESHGPHLPAFLAADVLDLMGAAIMQAEPSPKLLLHSQVEHHCVVMDIDLPPLVPNVYALSLWVGSHNTETLDQVREAVRFEVTSPPALDRTYPYSPDHGLIVPTSRVSYAVRPDAQ